MMPRRNRNASTSPSPDLLADQITLLAAALAAHAALCAACRVNLATTGGYCALCKGLITPSARRITLTRR